MLIALYFFLVDVLIPQLCAYAKALFEPVMIIVIMLAGIVMLFGAVGMKISNNLGSTIVNRIFQAIGYICRTIVRAIRWIVRSIVRSVPRIFNGSRNTFTNIGLNPLLSNVLAIIVVTIFLIIII